MAYTIDFNLPKLPSGAVDWIAAYNDLCDKIEAGRTISTLAGVNITQYQCFYINSSGKAVVASADTDVVGIWQSFLNTVDTLGLGQLDGTMTNKKWAWIPGTFLYSGINGDLSATPSKGRRVAYVLTATKILLLTL